jgi:CheY-like chemotaxis protein
VPIEPARSHVGADGSPSARAPGPILIVEDNSDTRATLRDLLEDEGYQVFEAADGMEARDVLIAGDAPEPSLVILDLGLPILSGSELLVIMHSYWRLSNIPVLVISGAELPHPAREDGGVVAYLRKPLDTLRLLAIVRRYARRRPIGSGELTPASGVVDVAVERHSTMPSPAIPVVVMIAPGEELLSSCPEIIRKLDDPPTVRVAGLVDASTVVARCRPFALVITDDVFAFDPQGFATLARGVGAEVIVLETDRQIRAVGAALSSSLSAALVRWKARQSVAL